MSTRPLDKETKLALLTDLLAARKSYHRSIARAEEMWQEHIYELNLMDNGVFEHTNLGTSFERAQHARRAIQPRLNFLNAKHDECVASGLDLGIDHTITQAVAA